MDPNMTGKMALEEIEFKTTVINMFKILNKHC